MGKEPRDTAFTRAFSGRSARGIQNQFIEAMDGKELLEFPLQNSLTGALRQWAAQHDEAEFQSVWAGTGRDIRPLPAVQLIQLLYEELNALRAKALRRHRGLGGLISLNGLIRLFIDRAGRIFQKL